MINDSYLNQSFTRICTHNKRDVYSESYGRKGTETSNKNSSFFLFTKELVSNYTSGSFHKDFVGQAICYFNDQATNQIMCFCKEYDYNGTGKAGEHVSGMWKIDMEQAKLSIIPAAHIIEPILSLHSSSLPLIEIKQTDGSMQELGMVIKPVHKM